MNIIVAYIARFVLFVTLQLLVFSQIELGLGIHLLMCPLYVLLLPFEINIFILLIVAFGMGFILDIFSNTYGLQASSLLLIAYIRPYVFKAFAPRDDYDPLKTPSYVDMGNLWYFSTFGSLLLIHNTWFFLLEAFSFRGILYTIQKIVFSFIFIYLLSLLLQIILVRRSKK
jgi:hypothetical protein